MLVFPLILAFVGCMFCTFCWSKINRRCNELHVKNANTCNFFDWFSYLWEMCEEAGLKPLLLPQIEVEPNLLKLNYLVSKKHVLNYLFFIYMLERFIVPHTIPIITTQEAMMDAPP